ncbi:hypothetical protein [Streptomyces exfoliatus]|uniref:hypothetical protein n=1 Tax=Streptomyces exfoliatus TaxID=1905 RepID=UPI0037A245F3
MRDDVDVWAMVHAERAALIEGRPLGLTSRYPPTAVVRTLRLQGRTPAAFGGAEELLARVRLVATDADLALGAGPEVNGPVLPLLLAVAGRPVAPGELGGPGVALPAPSA